MYAWPAYNRTHHHHHAVIIKGSQQRKADEREKSFSSTYRRLVHRNAREQRDNWIAIMVGLGFNVSVFYGRMFLS